MTTKGCVQCLRWLVFVFNLFFWLAGMGVLGVSLWLRFDPDVSNYMSLHDGLHDFYVGVYILIAVGVVMTILGFLGCCGALRESQCMLTSFFILLVIVFFAQLVCAILAFTHQDTVKQYIERSMYDTVYAHYYRKPSFTEIFDQIQNGLKCCGVRTYKDWLRSYFATDAAATVQIGSPQELDVGRVPESCCNQHGMITFPKDCGVSFYKAELWTYADFLHPTGCADALYDKIYTNLGICIAIAVGLGALQLIGMVLCMLLCCNINHRKRQEMKTGMY